MGPAPAARFLAPRPVAGHTALRRAREAAQERAVLASLVLVALTVSGLAGYAIHASSERYDVRAMGQSGAAPLAWKRGIETRSATADLEPVVTGALPERPLQVASADGTAALPAPGETGYVLRMAAGGGVTVEGRDGPMRIAVGSELPGAGRVLSIRNTSAGWIVITTETIIGPQPL